MNNNLSEEEINEVAEAIGVLFRICENSGMEPPVMEGLVINKESGSTYKYTFEKVDDMLDDILP